MYTHAYVHAYNAYRETDRQTDVFISCSVGLQTLVVLIPLGQSVTRSSFLQRSPRSFSFHGFRFVGFGIVDLDHLLIFRHRASEAWRHQGSDVAKRSMKVPSPIPKQVLAFGGRGFRRRTDSIILRTPKSFGFVVSLLLRTPESLC